MIDQDGTDDDNGAGASEAPVAKRLENMGVEELLQMAHEALIRRLTIKVMADTATKEDIAQLRQMLKDNGMVWPGVTTPNQNAGKAPEAPLDLPELGGPDYE